jgi:hypothetical protein
MKKDANSVIRRLTAAGAQTARTRSIAMAVAPISVVGVDRPRLGTGVQTVLQQSMKNNELKGRFL